MQPKTRLDRLVTIRERSEESALENLARARSSLDHAARRLVGLRQGARADGRTPGVAELWVVEETAHRRALQQAQRAEGELAQALRKEQTARAGYTAAYRTAEATRRIQEKKRAEIVEDRERRERRALDEVATLRFNASKA